MIPKEERYKYATEQFLASNLWLQQKLDQLNPIVAEHTGMSIEDYRKHELDNAFYSYAKSIGVDAPDLVIDICAKDEAEKKLMKIERHKAVAESILMDWDDYLRVHNLPELC